MRNNHAKSHWLAALVAGACYLGSPAAVAADYQIDSAHSFVQFRIQHLGYSWLYGRFNDVKGSFSYDGENPEAATVAVEVDLATIDTNHAERDKHLRGADFFNVSDSSVPATFKSTKFSGSGDEGTLDGELTINGVSKSISLAIKKIGEGKDPWGGYRAGFSGTMTMTRKDFGIDYQLGPASETMELEIGIEGIRQ